MLLLDGANGNMTNDGMNTQIAYDAENNAVSSSGSLGSGAYTYDGNGHRVQKVSGSTTAVYVFSGSKVVAECDNGAAPTAPSREYVYGGSALLAKIDSSGTKYYHQDHLSNRLVTDSSGNTLAQMGHFPFGESWYNATGDKLLFTTYERDAESGNDYAQARYYVNRLARFSALDPLSGSTSDPQSLNRYDYVLDDPTNLGDPSGACPNWEGTPYIVNGEMVCTSHAKKDPDQESLGGILWIDLTTTWQSYFDGFLTAEGGTFAASLITFYGPAGGDPGGGQASLNAKDQKRYDQLAARALIDIFNKDCISFLISKGIDPAAFASAVLVQNAYNGSQSTITQSEAGVGMPGSPTDSVSQGFKNGPNVRAVASTTSNDVYFRQGGFLSGLFGNGNIQEATIEHEALHNYLKIGDFGVGGLEDVLGLGPYNVNTSIINDALRKNHCSH